MEAHKVVLASSSLFFKKMFKKSKHPHPLTYLRGFQSKDFASLIDFIYFGEANVYQEDLDSFLVIAEDIQLKGLTNQSSKNLIQQHEEFRHPEPIPKARDWPKKSAPPTQNQTNVPSTASTAVVIQTQSSTHLLALGEKVKSMMEQGCISCGILLSGT